MDVGELLDRARGQLRVNPRESLRLAEAALEVAESIPDQTSLALALRAKGNACWLLNQNRKAVDHFDRAAALFRDLGNDTELGRTLSTSIQALIRLGEYGRALDGADRARQIFERSGDTLRLARLELNVANIHHRQDRFHQALEVYEHAYRQLVPVRDTEAIAVALHNMAVCLIALNDFEKALATHQRARAFCEEHDMPALVVQADYNISYLYYLRGEYTRALEGLRAAALAAREAGDAYHTALCAMDQAEIFLELNLSVEAGEMAEEAYTQFLALGMNYEAAKSLANVAIARRSLPLFSRARAIFAREGNHAWPSLIDLYQALVLYDSGRFAEALPLCRQALEFFRAGGMAAKETLCHLLIARLLLRLDERQEARAHCAAAQTLLETHPTAHLSYQAEFLMGQIEEADGNLTLAADRYRAAASAMEHVREILRDEELKIAFMQNKLEVYESLIRLGLAGTPADCGAGEIFAYMEQAKSRTMRDLFFEPRVATPEIGEMRDLRNQLNWYYHRIDLEQAGEEAASPERLAELHGEVAIREKKFRRMLRDLSAAGPAGAGAPNLDVDAIRAALGPDTVLVEYFRAGDRFLATVLSPGDLQVIPLALVSQVNPAIRLLQLQISKFGLGATYISASAPASLAATNAHLHELYLALAAPIRHLLTRGRVVFVPHESLHAVPLHALYDGAKYLIDCLTITYAPSASVYALCQAQPANTAGPSLILGVPDEYAPFIQEEIEAVAGVLQQAQLFSGDNATHQVLATRGPGSRVIHIATHGQFRRDNPMFSAIRLGDGYLTLYDLYNLRLPADLITLSGCSTGLNVVAKGDELLGLVRGLLHAGARTLLLTLWDVQDRTTSEIMKSFYTRLAAMDKGAALQGAMRDLREEHPHPYYWAPFVLIGSRL